MVILFRCKKLAALLGVCFLASLSAFSQVPDSIGVKLSRSELRSMHARNQLINLRSGALLVRLQTRSLAIEGLQEREMHQKAQELKAKQEKENAKVVKAFTKKFDYCPVYFFYSDDSRYVIDGTPEKIIFVNETLQRDSSIVFSANYYLVAEFGKVEQDTAGYFEGHYLESTETGVAQKNRTFKASNIGFGALVVRSDQMVQLRPPFPYYVRTYRGTPFARSYNRTVEIFNQNLKTVYGSRSEGAK